MKSIRIAALGRGFDAIHACNPPETFWALGWFWRIFNKRFLFDHHDLSPEMFAAKFGRSSGLLHSGLLFLERMTFKSADVVITTNESHKRIAERRGGVASDDIFVVRSGSPTSTASPAMPPTPPGSRTSPSSWSISARCASRTASTHMVRAVAPC